MDKSRDYKLKSDNHTKIVHNGAQSDEAGISVVDGEFRRRFKCEYSYWSDF